MDPRRPGYKPDFVRRPERSLPVRWSFILPGRRRPGLIAINPILIPTKIGMKAGRLASIIFDLAPSGVCLASRPCGPERWSLTPPFHPYPGRRQAAFGAVCFCGTIRFFRLIERPPGITPGHPTLRSPDFPPRTRPPKRPNSCEPGFIGKAAQSDHPPDRPRSGKKVHD